MPVNKYDDSKYRHATFKLRAASALAISLIGDLLDYIAAPIFDVPLAGDIFDVIPVFSLGSQEAKCPQP